MWDDLAALDPMWTILSRPDKIGNRWDEAAFFATGEAEVTALFEFMANAGINPVRERALDFGCGIGRLTRALAKRFEQCDGIDISAAMIDAAVDRNRDHHNIRWTVNETDDLVAYPSGAFTFVYTNITLQHLETESAIRYIAELLRVLAANGTLAFQMPDAGPYSAKRRLTEFIAPLAFRAPRPLLHVYRRLRYPPEAFVTLASLPRRVAEMHGMSPDRIRTVVGSSGATVVALKETDDAGPGWRSYLYCVRKIPSSSS